MAEINNSGGHGRERAGVRRSKKLSTKVDLTPMVDLGFLLITFFVFTTSLNQPKSMRLYLPAGNTPGNPLGESTALTVIPIANDKVFYYHGDMQTALSNNAYGTTTFSVQNGIGDVIRQKQAALAKTATLKKDDLTLIIKPSTDARYQTVVDALDEVLINNLHHYAFVDLDEAEKEAMTRLAIK